MALAWSGFEAWDLERFERMPGFGSSHQDCTWEIVHIQREVQLRGSKNVPNKKKKSNWTQLLDLRMRDGLPKKQQEAFALQQLEAIRRNSRHCALLEAIRTGQPIEH